MKKLTALLAIVLVLAMFCGQALASEGDITKKAAKAYSDASMTQYVGTVPAWMPVVVSSYGSSRISLFGVTLYVSNGALLNGDGTGTDGKEDLITKKTKAYSNAAMTKYVGTIPANTTVTVKAYGSNAKVSVAGKKVYVKSSNLLHGDMAGAYNAKLAKGTRVYQYNSSKAKSVKLKKARVVNICAVKGDWALVRRTSGKLLFGYVKLDQLTNVEAAN